MPEEWVEYKSKLLRAFTASGILSPEGSTFHTEFRNFLAKYEKKVLAARESSSRKRRRDPQWIGREEDVPRNSGGVPTGPYNKFHSVDIRLSDQCSSDQVFSKQS